MRQSHRGRSLLAGGTGSKGFCAGNSCIFLCAIMAPSSPVLEGDAATGLDEAHFIPLCAVIYCDEQDLGKGDPASITRT